MNTREALEQSFQIFDLKASEIADKAGISPEIMSRFRHGKGITVDTLDKIVQALPPTGKGLFLFIANCAVRQYISRLILLP